MVHQPEIGFWQRWGRWRESAYRCFRKHARIILVLCISRSYDSKTLVRVAPPNTTNGKFSNFFIRIVWTRDNFLSARFLPRTSLNTEPVNFGTRYLSFRGQQFFPNKHFSLDNLHVFLLVHHARMNSPLRAKRHTRWTTKETRIRWCSFTFALRFRDFVHATETRHGN